MGLLQNLREKTISLLSRTRTLDPRRQKLFQLLGSFNVNKLGTRGSSLIKNTYETNVDVYALIQRIIQTSKSVTWIVEHQESDGTWKLIENTPIHDLMAMPNKGKGYTWDDIQEQYLLYLLVTGNSYMVGEFLDGFKGIQEVDILPSFATDIKVTDNFFDPQKIYKFDLNRTKRTFAPEEIEHIKFFNPAYSTVKESCFGLSPIQVAARAIQVSNDRWEADASLMQNRGAIGMITDRSYRPMTKEQAQEVQDAFDEDMVGASRFGKTKVTNKDLNYIQMAMSSVDLQLLEKGVVNLRSLCNVFSLASSLFNDPANKTFNNRLEAQKSMFTDAVIPLSIKIAAAHTNFIARSFFPDGRTRMRQDFSDIEALQKNLAEKAKTAVELVKAGILTRNEARDIVEHERVKDPQADTLTQTNGNNVTFN